MLTATVIGSGPNGLSAAIVLAAAGLDTTVFRRTTQIGGAWSSAETTLPNFRQDLVSFSVKS
jgi:phytoene dehydrogenase-like protein